MKYDKETILQEQIEAERNLSLEQCAQARDIFHPVPTNFTVLVYAQECAMRAEESEAPDSPMGEYCRLMCSLHPEDRRLVAQNNVPKDAEKGLIMRRAVELRTRLLSYEKTRPEYLWEKSAI